MDKLPELTQIHVINCDLLTRKGMEAISEHCQKLEALYLENLRKLEKFSSYISSGAFNTGLHFPSLRQLHIENCPNLHTIVMNARVLLDLTLINNPEIKTLCTYTRNLSYIKWDAPNITPWPECAWEFIEQNQRNLRYITIGCEKLTLEQKEIAKFKKQKGYLYILREIHERQSKGESLDEDQGEACRGGNIIGEALLLGDRKNESLRMAIRSGANVNAPCGGEYPLHTAISYSKYHDHHEEAVKILILHGANVNALTYRDRDYCYCSRSTPLHIAVINQNLRLTTLLVQHKANVNIQDEEGNTPLHIAVAKGNLKIVSFLIHHGALLNLPNKKGKLPLDLAKNSAAMSELLQGLPPKRELSAINIGPVVDLSGCRIPEIDFPVLLSWIESDKIIKIDLSRLQLETILDFDSLVEALRKNSSITYLKLSWNYLVSSTTQALANALSTNTTLTNLDLSNVQMDPQDIEEIANALEKNITLKVLTFSEMDFPEPYSSRIKAIIIRNNNFNPLIQTAEYLVAQSKIPNNKDIEIIFPAMETLVTKAKKQFPSLVDRLDFLAGLTMESIADTGASALMHYAQIPPTSKLYGIARSKMADILMGVTYLHPENKLDKLVILMSALFYVDQATTAGCINHIDISIILLPLKCYILTGGWEFALELEEVDLDFLKSLFKDFLDELGRDVPINEKEKISNLVNACHALRKEADSIRSSIPHITPRELWNKLQKIERDGLLKSQTSDLKISVLLDTPAAFHPLNEALASLYVTSSTDHYSSPRRYSFVMDVIEIVTNPKFSDKEKLAKIKIKNHEYKDIFIDHLHKRKTNQKSLKQDPTSLFFKPLKRELYAIKKALGAPDIKEMEEMPEERGCCRC